MSEPLSQHTHQLSARVKARAVICLSCLMTFACTAMADLITAIAPVYSVDGFATVAINNGGQVVGYSDTTNGQNGFFYSNGKLIALGVLAPTAINDSDQIVGSFVTTTGAEHAFLYSGGSVTDLGTLGGTFSAATGINNGGQVVGYSDTTVGGEHAFLYSGGRMTDLGTLGGDLSVAYGLNDSGQIVGTSNTSGSGGVFNAFLYSGGNMTSLLRLDGFDETHAIAINNGGQIAGFGIGENSSQAFLYRDGTVTELPVGTMAFGINDRGDVVGISGYPYGPQYPFLYSNGILYDLNSFLPPNSGWQLSDAYGINDSDQIVGIGSLNGTAEAFLLNAGNVSVPEPSYLVLFAGGLFACLGKAVLERMKHRDRMPS